MIPTDALASGRSHQPCGNSRGTPSPSTDDEIIDVLSMPSSAVRSSWPTCRLGARYLGPARFRLLRLADEASSSECLLLADFVEKRAG